MLQHLNDLIADHLKSIGMNLLLQQFDRLAMSPQINQQYVKMFSELPDLSEPDATAATCTVYKSNPLSRFMMVICAV
jgi:hypothetical protein